MAISDGWSLWLRRSVAIAGVGVSACGNVYEERTHEEGEVVSDVGAAGGNYSMSHEHESHPNAERMGEPAARTRVSLEELPALATLHFGDGNKLAIREFAGGLLVTETGRLGTVPRRRPHQTWAELFRELAPEVEVPAALLARDKQSARGGPSMAGHLPSFGQGSQLDDDVTLREAGEFEQSSGLFPAENFVAQFCRMPAVSLPFEYVRTNLTSPETQSFNDTHTSYYAVAADRGDVRAFVSSDIPGFEGDVFGDVREGTVMINSFEASPVVEGQCLDFLLFQSCSEPITFLERGFVRHGVDEVASTDRYHHCGYMTPEQIGFVGLRP